MLDIIILSMLNIYCTDLCRFKLTDCVLNFVIKALLKKRWLDPGRMKTSGRESESGFQL
jgi:hypothetical protein